MVRRSERGQVQKIPTDGGRWGVDIDRAIFFFSCLFFSVHCSCGVVLVSCLQIAVRVEAYQMSDETKSECVALISLDVVSRSVHSFRRRLW